MAAPDKFKTPHFCKLLSSMHQFANKLFQREHGIEGKSTYDQEKYCPDIYDHNTYSNTLNLIHFS
jgi:hypothetical protein